MPVTVKKVPKASLKKAPTTKPKYVDLVSIPGAEKAISAIHPQVLDVLSYCHYRLAKLSLGLKDHLVMYNPTDLKDYTLIYSWEVFELIIDSKPIPKNDLNKKILLAIEEKELLTPLTGSKAHLLFLKLLKLAEDGELFSSKGLKNFQVPKVVDVHGYTGQNELYSNHSGHTNYDHNELAPEPLSDDAEKIPNKLIDAADKAIDAALSELETTTQEVGEDVIALGKATAPYQKVHGTSPNSVYLVVLVKEGELNMAARLMNGQLSLRIEGPTLNLHLSLLKEVGFMTVHAPKGYVSLHLSVGTDQVLARKALGAMIQALDPIFAGCPVPDFYKLVNEGT